MKTTSKPFSFSENRDAMLSAMFACADAPTLKMLRAATAPSGDTHIADLHRQKNALIAAARVVLDAGNADGRAPTEREQLAIDGFIALAEEIGNAISLRDGARQHFAGTGDRWIDSEGREVRVLDKADRFSDIGPQENRFGVGAIMRAMAGVGRIAPEVKAALGESADSTGGVTVPDVLLGEWIDRMRAQTVAIEAGARTVALQSDLTRIARLNSDPVAGWRSESGLIAESDPTFNAVDFTARSLAVMVKVPLELLQDSVNGEEMLRAAMTQALARELDRVALFGSGTAPEPRGVFNTAGISTLSMGTNGAAIANYDPFVDGVTTLATANSAPPTAAIMAPRTFGSLSKVKDTTGQPITAPAIVANLPMLRTTAVPINQTQGTAVGVASTILVGDFSRLMIGIRQSLRLEVVRGPYLDRLQVAFIAYMRADIQLAQPAAFCRIVGVL